MTLLFLQLQRFRIRFINETEKVNSKYAVAFVSFMSFFVARKFLISDRKLIEKEPRANERQEEELHYQMLDDATNKNVGDCHLITYS